MNKLKGVLPVLLLGNLLCMMDVSIMTIVLPEIQSAFGESLTELSWALNVYTIIFATLIIPFGRLAERFGQNKFVFAGLVVFGTGSLLTGMAPNLTWMLIARAIQSIGAAAIIPTSMVIGLDLSSMANRNRVVAALAGVQGLAVALGPTIGGIVAQYFGWRWVFFINVPLVVLDLLVFGFVLPLRHEKTTHVKIDWLGATLSMIMLFSLSLGLIKGNDWGWQSPVILSLFALALIGFLLFLFWERHTKVPMVDLQLFRSRNFNGSSLALVLCNFFLGGMAVLLPTFLTRVHGTSELKAALLMTPYSVTVMITVILTSLVIKRINNKVIVAAGFLLMGVSYLLLSTVPMGSNYHQLILADVLLGLGYGLVAATANILAVADFHGSRLTSSQSVANVLRQVGMVLAIAVFTTLLTSNVTQAKRNTLADAQTQVSRLANVTTAQKNTLTRKLRRKLNPNSTTVTATAATVTSPTVTISAATRQQKATVAYRQAIQQLATVKQVSPSLIPQVTKQQIHHTITLAVNRKITQKVQQLNQELANLVHTIRQALKHHLNHAFLNVFGSLSWLPFAALLIVPVFKFRRED
ncbi:MFS transporter [Levilactobacillus wangkuiensis]|uniref:MFS transporter n=1 Tax=Levilactobacillus wangkuiensis TaxID=2799566 RepID=UPI00194EF98E|nr:MFS transporter [Levilactobacillus wangkuiensis]